MAYFAKLGLNSKVIAVVAVADKDCLNGDGTEDEEVGRSFLEELFSWPLWKQTSYNTFGGIHKDGKTPVRGNYASVGMIYDEDNDIFIGKKPYASWVLNAAEARWQSPSGDAPDLGAEAATHYYEWNESDQSLDKKEKFA